MFNTLRAAIPSCNWLCAVSVSADRKNPRQKNNPATAQTVPGLQSHTF